MRRILRNVPRIGTKALIEQLAAPVAYVRDQGAIGFKAPIFNHNFQDPPHDVSQLLDVPGTTWYWESKREREVHEVDRSLGLPDHRSLTMLTESNIESLRVDYSEERIDGYSRNILILGVDSGVELAVHDQVAICSLIQRFVEREEGPIRIVISQLGDSQDFVFVPHDPLKSVQELLNRWGLNIPPSGGKRRYKELRGAKLEERFSLPPRS